MNFELENSGTVEELIQALNFWQTVAAYLIEAKDEPVVIVHLPESEKSETYKKMCSGTYKQIIPGRLIHKEG